MKPKTANSRYFRAVESGHGPPRNKKTSVFFHVPLAILPQSDYNSIIRNVWVPLFYAGATDPEAEAPASVLSGPRTFFAQTD